MKSEYQRKYANNEVEGVEISCVGIAKNILQIFVCCQALADILKHNSTLTSLNLSGNNIGPEEAQAWCLVRMVRILRNRS